VELEKLEMLEKLKKGWFFKKKGWKSWKNILCHDDAHIQQIRLEKLEKVFDLKCFWVYSFLKYQFRFVFSYGF